MASLYAQYLRERTDDLIIETEYGFASYRYLEGNQSVYIVDIFIHPDCRKDGGATRLANAIAKEAKDRGCIEMLGTVVPSMKNSTASVKVLLAYGMTVRSCSQDFIVFRKDL